MKNIKNAIILCSGGLDSVITGNYVKKLGYNKLIILFFNFQQRTIIQERKSSKGCAEDLKAVFKEIKIDLRKISDSLISNKKKSRKVTIMDLKDTKKESEKFYVPFRNSIFLIYAIALTDFLFIKNKEIYDIFVGFKCEGKENYPDTTIKFVNSINKLAKFSNFKGKILAPLIKKDKNEISLFFINKESANAIAYVKKILFLNGT